MNTDLTLDLETPPDPELLRLDELLDQRRDASTAPIAASELAGQIDAAGLNGEQLEHLRLSAALFDALDEQKITGPVDLADAVLARIEAQRQPSASWRSLALAAATIAALVLASVLLFGQAGQDGIFGTLADVALSAVTAGAGLMNASWKGAATLVGSWFESSPVTLFGALFGLLGAQAFAWSRLRRRGEARATRD